MKTKKNKARRFLPIAAVFFGILFILAAVVYILTRWVDATYDVDFNILNLHDAVAPEGYGEQRGGFDPAGMSAFCCFVSGFVYYIGPCALPVQGIRIPGCRKQAQKNRSS